MALPSVSRRHVLNKPGGSGLVRLVHWAWAVPGETVTSQKRTHTSPNHVTRKVFKVFINRSPCFYQRVCMARFRNQLPYSIRDMGALGLPISMIPSAGDAAHILGLLEYP